MAAKPTSSTISQSDLLFQFQSLIKSTKKDNLQNCIKTLGNLDQYIGKLDEPTRAQAIASYLNNPLENPQLSIARASGWIREYPFADASKIGTIVDNSKVAGLSKVVLDAVNTTALKSKKQNAENQLAMVAARASAEDPAQVTTLSKIEKKED